MAKQPHNSIHQRLVTCVLRPSGVKIPPNKERAAISRLVEIAQYTENMNALRNRPSRTRTMVKRPVGRPRTVAMRQLFGSMAGFWFEFTGELPGVSYFGMTDTISGPFVTFSQAFCRELSADLKREDPGGHKTLIARLEDISATPVRVKTWLRELGLPQLKGRLKTLESRVKARRDPLNTWLRSKCIPRE
jgi:hypothetical protein